MILLMMMMESVRHSTFCYFFVETNINFLNLIRSTHPNDDYQVNLHDFIPFCTKYIQISLIFYTILQTFSFFLFFFAIYYLTLHLYCMYTQYIHRYIIYIYLVCVHKAHLLKIFRLFPASLLLILWLIYRFPVF